MNSPAKTPRQANAQNQVNPQGQSDLQLRPEELSAFFEAQQDYFIPLLQNSQARQLSMGGLTLYSGDRSIPGFLACLIGGLLVWIQAIEHDSSALLLLTLILEGGALYFLIRYLNRRLTGRARGVTAYQQELGRSQFLAAFCKEITPLLNPQDAVHIQLDHRSHKKYARTWAFKDILKAEPVLSIEKESHQQSYLWADLTFSLRQGHTLHLRCLDVVPRGAFYSHPMHYRMELSCTAMYPETLTFFVRPAASVPIEKERWSNGTEPPLFNKGNTFGEELAEIFKIRYIPEAAPTT